MKSLSSNTIFGKPTEVSGYTDADLDEGDIFFSGSEEEMRVFFELPFILKNSLQEPSVDVNIQFIPFDSEHFVAPGQCESSSSYGEYGPTTFYYSIDEGTTQSVEATCGMMLMWCPDQVA